MPSIPLPPQPDHAPRRVGLFWIFMGTKMLAAAVSLPVSRRLRVGLGLGGGVLVAHGTLRWLAGKQAQEAIPPEKRTSREIKAIRGLLKK